MKKSLRITSNMKKIIELHPELYDRALFLQSNYHFMDTVYICMQNIKKQNVLFYNLNNPMERKQYIQKYFYTINEVFLSFNDFLLKSYIYRHEFSTHKYKDSDWKDIFDVQNRKGKNNIVSLLNFFFQNDISNFYFLETIHKFYIYENVFRNHISHGWINSLYSFLDLSLEITSFCDFPNKKTKEKPKIVQIGNKDLNDIRKENKEGSLFSFTEDMTEKQLKKYCPLGSDDNKFYIEEFMLEYLLINDEIDDMHLKELTKFMEKNPNHQDFLVSKFLFNCLTENKVKNQKYSLNFSLNNLMEDIMHCISRLMTEKEYKY